MRLVVVSNRLPVVLERQDDGWKFHSSSGGLVTALNAILRRHGGIWVGWPGTGDATPEELAPVLNDYSQQASYQLGPVALTQAQVDGFYKGFANEIVWPLFHDLQSRCNFVPEYWQTYLDVQQRFAAVVAELVRPGDFIWVQDYHLMGVAQHLREMGVSNRIGFFLHIPFPPPDIFAKLPWRNEVLERLLHFDLVGLQTPHDLENLLDCMRRLMPHVRLGRERGVVHCVQPDRVTHVGAFPIGIDYERFAQGAASECITQRMRTLRHDMPNQQIVLGIDRLDYTKGIPDRLRAFQQALRRFPELHRSVTLLQVVVPSRETVPEYQELKARIERLVAQINGEFTQPGWVPIHYVFRSLGWEDLLSYYRAGDVALITPLKDGMNLIAKEYCACQVEGDGVLILSEFAGAAHQLRHGAILVNPYDLDRVADAIRHGVTLSRRQRRPAMRRLRNLVRKHDVYHWVERFLRACRLEPATANTAALIASLTLGSAGVAV